MIRRSVSCSWCHATNSLDNPAQVHCVECGHRADVPRAECDCPKCKPTAEERERQAQLDRLGMQYMAAVASGDVDTAGALWGMAETDQALAVRLHELDAGLERLGFIKGA